MKDNPFYQVSGEVVVGSLDCSGTVRAWVTYCEEPTYANELDFDLVGDRLNEMNLEQFLDVSESKCVLSLPSGEVILLIYRFP